MGILPKCLDTDSPLSHVPHTPLVGLSGHTQRKEMRRWHDSMEKSEEKLGRPAHG